MTRTFLLSLAVGSSVLSAQQQPLIGAWQVSYTAGMRIENGMSTPLMATGLLTIVVKGDSLVGELAINPSPDVPARPPTRLTARLTNGSPVTFMSRSEATLNINGEERKATVVGTWTLRVESDSLIGTVERKLEGHEMGNQEPRPVTGVRAKD
jgi:hypothetical protein